MPFPTTPTPRGIAWQYVDVAVLVGALCLASFLVLKQRSRKSLIGLSVFSLLYFGFFRDGCVCAIGSIQNVALGLFDSRYAVPFTVLAFFLAPLVTALFAGRTFCAGVCPHGALQDLVLWKPVKVPTWLEQALSVLPYVYLGAGVLFAATGSAFVICQYDPFVPIFRMNGSFTMLMLGAGFVVLGMFVGRPYCRFLCPFGALLRLAGTVSKWRVMISPDDCKKCRMCDGSCPYDAIREPSPTAEMPTTPLGERRRLAILVLVAPVLVALGGWLGSQLSVPLSRMHPTVDLAERHAAHQVKPVQAPPQTAPVLSMQRADQNPKDLLANALKTRNQFVLG
ncbi:MAG TPA: 4Fe-4S binding protein, partial [Bacillota bacterium]|nr:4Fe-4S binding protein [Bacillota bacterium]